MKVILPSGGLKYFRSAICATCKMALAKPRICWLCLLTKDPPESRFESGLGVPGRLASLLAEAETRLDSNGVFNIDFPPHASPSHCMSYPPFWIAPCHAARSRIFKDPSVPKKIRSSISRIWSLRAKSTMALMSDVAASEGLLASFFMSNRSHFRRFFAMASLSLMSFSRSSPVKKKSNFKQKSQIFRKKTSNFNQKVKF